MFSASNIHWYDMSGVAKGHGGGHVLPIINIVANCFLQLILRSYVLLGSK